ncbi:hypothetical protein WEI85_00095 [Actinomycetes bacterium KLBMP 9797]
MRLSTAVLAQAMQTLRCPQSWYHDITQYYATAFWLAGAEDRFIQEVETVEAGDEPADERQPPAAGCPHGCGRASCADVRDRIR